MPSVQRIAVILGRSVTRRPAPFLVVVFAVTVALGFAATDLVSEFSIRDILPRGGSVLEDMKTLDATVGGSTEMISVLVKAEATETRTLLNMHDLTTGFEDDARRPRAAAGPIQESFDVLVNDWIDDSGGPGDKYDPELEALFREASAGVELDAALMQEFLDKLEVKDPTVAELLVNNPDGRDATLLQFPAYLYSGVDLRWRCHGVQREAEGVAQVHAGNECGRKSETQVRFRHELWIAGVKAQDVVGELPGTVGPLGGRVHIFDSLQQFIDGLGPAPHSRSTEHESWQGLYDVSKERPLLVFHQVVDDVLGINPNG